MSKFWPLFAGILLWGCVDDPKKTKIVYMPDMADSPTVKTQRSYLPPPEGSVSRAALLYPPDRAIEEWETRLHNPFKGHQQAKRFKEEGAELYRANCYPCHGKEGNGLEGTMTDKYPIAPNIGDPAYLERGDGFFFHKITVGGGLMPSRREALDPQERWKVVLHLRELQKKHKAEQDAGK